jgi:hypothetical protein
MMQTLEADNMATKLFRSILPPESSDDEDPDENGEGDEDGRESAPMSESEDGCDVGSISEKIDE